MKKIFNVVVSILLVISLVGCASGRNSAKDEYYGSSDNITGDSFLNGSYDKIESDVENAPQEGDGSVNSGVLKDEKGEFLDRKIVYTVKTELQTKDFNVAMQILNTTIEECGGYIQSQKQTNNGSIYSQYSYRSLNMVVRVPSENLEKFLSGLQNENMYTINLSKDSKDYSTTYYDKETRISSLKIQEERLLNMLSTSSDLKTMLELEDRLTDVRYEIETLTKEMKYIDSNVAYSTVTIAMSEVVKYDEKVTEPKTFFEKVKEAIANSWGNFIDGLQNFIIDIIYALPTLIILAIVVIVGVRIMKKAKRKKVVKKEEQETKEDIIKKTK